jgi:hypothetical protein
LPSGSGPVLISICTVPGSFHQQANKLRNPVTPTGVPNPVKSEVSFWNPSFTRVQISNPVLRIHGSGSESVLKSHGYEKHWLTQRSASIDHPIRFPDCLQLIRTPICPSQKANGHFFRLMFSECLQGTFFRYLWNFLSDWIRNTFFQCCGSKCFWASWIRIRIH